MPNINTTFGAGGAANTVLDREGVDIGARPDFWSDLEKMSRVMRPARTTPVAQGRALAEAPGYSSGTGPMLREGVGVQASDPNPTGAGLGAHSFVQNMWGANQVGGYVPTGFGPRSVYGGWDPTGGGRGGATVNPHVPAYRSMFEGEDTPDPAARSMALNASLGPSLADMQRAERVSASARQPIQGTPDTERRREPARSYAGRGGGR